MAKSVLELAVNTGKWDAGIKKAQSSLNNFIDANGGLQKTLQKDSSSVQQFVTMMGKIDSTAKTGKGQINDYRAAFEQLSRVYGQLTEQEKKSPLGQSMSQSLDQIRKKTEAARQELEEINNSFNGMKMDSGGGGGFGDLTTALFGADLAAGLAKDAISAVGQTIVETTSKALELSTEAEGIRMAFDRLNKPDLLQQLREATHGTVNDIELMKSAVKFNDFNLSLSELGTMLEFAQQKAKDTGQSVDYLVDSIVTGLGRQSTQILDNLGLSQEEVKRRTKETGDMTVAVGQIIREQMSNAGEYVETAADKAARANAELDNQLLELGDRMRETFGIGSMEEFSVFMKTRVAEAVMYTVDWFNDAKTSINNVWNSYMELTAPLNAVYDKIEAIADSNAVTRWMFKVQSLVNPLLQVYTVVRNIGEELGLGGGGGGVGGAMSKLSGYINDAKSQGNGDKYTVVKRGGKVVSATHSGADGSTIDYTGRYATPAAGGGGKGGRGGRGGRGGGGGSTHADPLAGSIDWQAEQVQKLQKAWRAAADDDSRQKIKEQLDEANAVLEKMEGKAKPVAAPEMAEGKSGLNAETFDAVIKMYQDALKGADFGTPLYESLANSLADATALKSLLEEAFNAGLTDLGVDPEELWESILNGENIPDEVLQGIVDRINAALSEKGITLGLDTKTGKTTEKKAEKTEKKQEASVSKIVSGVSDMVGGLQSLGINVPSGITKVLATMQVIIGIISAMQMILAIIGVNSSIPFLAHGGVIRAAGGVRVPGNSNSGDRVPALLNSGEVVLNRAEAGNLASQLNSASALSLTAVLNGEDILLAVDNASRRRGKGTVVRMRS